MKHALHFLARGDAPPIAAALDPYGGNHHHHPAGDCDILCHGTYRRTHGIRNGVCHKLIDAGHIRNVERLDRSVVRYANENPASRKVRECGNLRRERSGIRRIGFELMAGILAAGKYL
ncbi:MAG TPA: hypothetical protein VHW09_00515 [Bryobacteraceae bacterium]|nr:hypothetical protein [Bryobacteraceae bacterium]